MAFSGSETANWLQTNGSGWGFDEDLFEELRAFFAALTVGEWTAMVALCGAAPDILFTGESDYHDLSARIKGLAKSKQD